MHYEVMSICGTLWSGKGIIRSSLVHSSTTTSLSTKSTSANSSCNLGIPSGIVLVDSLSFSYCQALASLQSPLLLVCPVDVDYRGQSILYLGSLSSATQFTRDPKLVPDIISSFLLVSTLHD